MGAWGPAIFSDDVAQDIRSGYRELLEDGHDGDKATRLLLEKYQNSINDQDEGPTVWLALAATQWQYGRLEDEVKNRAIEIIDTGVGLDLWEEAGEKVLKARKAALNKLRDKLLTPQPPPKKVRKPWRYETDLHVGDAVSYRLDNGKFIILRVVGIESNRYYIAPIFELCDWVGEIIPSAKQIERLPYIIEEGDIVDRCFHTIIARKKGAYPIEIVARGLRVRLINKTYAFGSWESVYSWLNEISDRLSTSLPGLFSKKRTYVKLR